MNEVRSFPAPGLKVEALGQALVQWFQYQQRMEAQLIAVPEGLLVQAKHQPGWRGLVGMSSALNVMLRQSGDTLTVEIGAGKWTDEAVAAGVGMFILWPLAFTAAYGVWQQKQFPERTFQFVQQFLLGGAAAPPAFATAGAPAPAMAVGAPAPAPAPAAAAPTAGAARFCSQCGAALAVDHKFCPSCGHAAG